MTAIARKAAFPALAIAALLATSPALAQEAPPSRVFEATTMNLSAEGHVDVVPDQATITLGMQTQAPTAAEAMRANANQMSAVMAALRKAGVPERSIRTSNLSLSAQYSYPQNLPAQLTGYQASNDVTVTLDDVRAVGAVVDAASGAGANQVEGIAFGLKDSTAAEDAARVAAVKALTAKATLYAQATGYHVQRLVNLSEGGGYQPGPVRPMMAFAKVAADAPTPVSPGQLTVQITVSATYELVK